MIRYLDPMYTTEKTADKVTKVRSKIKIGAGMLGLYIISLSETESDVFDIYNVALFKQRYFRHRDYDIVGIAENEEAAYELVRRIHDDYFKAFGTYIGIKAELRARLDMQENKN